MTKKVLIIDDQEEILEILQLYIEGAFQDVETIIANGGIEAIEILKSEDISSIVCDFRMPEGDGSLVFDYNEKYKQLPFCWHSGTYKSDIEKNTRLNKKHIFHVNKPSTEEDICTTLSSMLTLAREISDLRRIRINLLKKVSDLNIDIYLKIGESKKILINNESEAFPKEKMIDLETKGVEFLYIKKDCFSKISNFFWSEFEGKIKKANSIEDVYFVVDDYVKGIQQALGEIGIDDKLFEVGLQCANACLKKLNKDEALKALLSGKVDHSNYISNHSLLTVQIAGLFISDADLLELLAQAAIFHDLSLSNERLAKLTPFDEEFEKLTSAEKELVANHGAKIVEILNTKDFLPEIKGIIMRHHKNPNDSSWINNCGIIEAAFYISHEIAHLCCSKNVSAATAWLEEQRDTFEKSIYADFYKRIFKIFVL